MKIATATTEALEARLEAIEEIEDCTDAESDEGIRIERELDARALWNHSDGRVRESVGNYR